jgi:hypothetical protein
VALNITLIVIAVAVTGFTIATSALSCKALCCQNKTQGALLSQPGLYHLFAICLFSFTTCLPLFYHLFAICCPFAYYLFTNFCVILQQKPFNEITVNVIIRMM